MAFGGTTSMGDTNHISVNLTHDTVSPGNHVHSILGPENTTILPLPSTVRFNMVRRETMPLNPPLSDPSYQQQDKRCLPVIKRPIEILSRRRTSVCKPFHYIFEHNFFEYQTDEDLVEEMFEERRRDWEARIVRDSLEVQRINSQNVGSASKRSQSTLEQTPTSNGRLLLSPVGPRAYGDREDGRRKKLYTSSAFDATRADERGRCKPRHAEGDPNSPVSPPALPKSPERSPGWRGMNLSIEIPEPEVPKQVVFHGRLPDHDRGKPERNGIDRNNREAGVSTHFRDRSKEGKQIPSASAQRTMLRVTSNFETSLQPSVDAACYQDRQRDSINTRTPNLASLSLEYSNPVQQQNLQRLSPVQRPFDRMRKPRNVGSQPTNTCSPDRVPISAQRSRFDQSAMRSPPNKLKKTIPIAKNNSFNVISHEEQEDEPEVVHVEEAFRDSPRGLVLETGRSRECSDFSRLSAESWRSIESEQELTERETRLLTSSSSSGCQNTTISSGTSLTHTSEDHDPQTIFGVDCRGDLLERMSNDNPYCLSVLECCTLLQTGEDVSKKLTFNRCEHRRVWMSSDFLYLCWSSRKSTTKEDQIELARIARMKLTDKNLVIDMICGYSTCLVFPSVTTAGLWVRALSCLVPLQTNIKVPLGVIIPTETEREEFDLAEDTFTNKHVREYMSVNNYVTLCNLIFVPPSMGLKLAFSTTENRFYGLRYIPKKSVRFMLRTRKEIAILKTLKHQHIVQYHEVLEDPERGGMYVIYENLSRGCIADSGNLQRMPIFKESQVRVVMIDIINALLYLHARRISHGDIRPENVLVAANGEAKLNPIGCIMHDFSSINSNVSHIRSRLGASSQAFLAPEQCWLTKAPKVGKESNAADVWGVAALMFTLLYGKTPFHGSSSHEVQENICWSTLRFPLDPHVSKESKSLMFQILSNKDPRTRMKLVEVRDHPWFHDFSILSPTSSRIRFPDYFESGINDSSLTDFSEEDLSGVVQTAKLRVTAKKHRARKATK